MSEHTNGPWVATGEADWVCDHYLWCGNVQPSTDAVYRGSICDVQSADHIGGISREEAEANARLIAAAPDLLAALERAREAVNAIVLSTHSISFDADLRTIDAAIHLAKHGAASTNEEAV